MKHEELMELIKAQGRQIAALEMRVAVLERRSPATSRGNYQEDWPDSIRHKGRKSRHQLPERCWELLRRARDGGLLGEDWRSRLSQRETGILVNIISQEVWGERRWKPFEDLFQTPNLQQHYQKATFLTKFCETEARINMILGL